MKFSLVPLFILSCLAAFAQAQPKSTIDSLNFPYVDSLVKDRLVQLASTNPAITGAEAQLSSAKYELKKAKTSWLKSITLSGNVNEFVVNNTDVNGVRASLLYPKYNGNITIPLDIFSSQQKNIANQKIKFQEAQKEVTQREVKKVVLTRYEIYKEKREIVELQKLLTDGQYTSYQQRQKEFASGEITAIADVNKEYEMWINYRSNQRTKESELKIAELDLEEIIGMKFSDAIKDLFAKP